MNRLLDTLVLFLTPALATPAAAQAVGFSPAGGSYPMPMEVSLVPTELGRIYYTTDGSSPHIIGAKDAARGDAYYARAYIPVGSNDVRVTAVVDARGRQLALLLHELLPEPWGL
jgi:hypothetical protein